MDPNYWRQKWESGDTQFHQDLPHPQLVQQWADLKATKVMVPLCGKSNDLLWLRSKGHEVVGIELSLLACEAFFVENKIPFAKRTSGPATIFEGDGIKLWCGDILQIPVQAWAGCKALYDRAALIALPEEMRKLYATHVIQSWTAGREMLLISIDYKSPTLIGPPFSVPLKEIQALYGKTFKIEKLHSERDSGLSDRAPKFTGIEVTENVFKLSR